MTGISDHTAASSFLGRVPTDMRVESSMTDPRLQQQLCRERRTTRRYSFQGNSAWSSVEVGKPELPSPDRNLGPPVIHVPSPPD